MAMLLETFKDEEPCRGEVDMIVICILVFCQPNKGIFTLLLIRIEYLGAR